MTSSEVKAINDNIVTTAGLLCSLRDSVQEIRDIIAQLEKRIDELEKSKDECDHIFKTGIFNAGSVDMNQI